MNSIRQQLTQKLLFVTILMISIGGVAVYFLARTALEAEFDAVLHAKAQTLINLTEQKGRRVEIEFSREHLQNFEKGGNDFFELRRADGTSVERSRSLLNDHLPKDESKDEVRFWNFSLSGSLPARAIRWQFQPQQGDEDNEKHLPENAVIVVASNRRDLDRTLTTLALILTGSSLLLIGATWFVVPRVLRQGLLPLQQLADQTSKIDVTSLSSRFPINDLPAELTPIATRLNELLKHLEESFERERRFSSDVAHEFRTPIAELRSLAELAIKMPETRTPKTMEEILTVTLNLESVLRCLLHLARGESGNLPVNLQQVKVSPLIHELCKKSQAAVAASALKLNVRVPDNIQAHADEVLLRSILNNLLENAVNYTPARGSVDIEASIQNENLTIRVINSVDNLTEEDLQRLFERFWRKDAARSGDGHSGLGLALAQTFARAMNCELTASLLDSKRLAMTLRWNSRS
jgi:signal transduction histidine kinase